MAWYTYKGWYNKGFKIGCFTASSKGNTLLNSLKLNKKIIKFASENNKKKIGKYTPGSHIQIISDKDFIKKKIDYAVLLSWNYKSFFLSKLELIFNIINRYEKGSVRLQGYGRSNRKLRFSQSKRRD